MTETDPQQVLTVEFPDGQASVWVHVGVKKSLAKYLTTLRLYTGVKVSRSDFILQAVRHYLAFLMGLTREALKDQAEKARACGSAQTRGLKGASTPPSVSKNDDDDESPFDETDDDEAGWEV